jgi:hypothetical protein
MQLLIVPSPLIGQRATERKVSDEMFRVRIVNWARILSIFTCTMATLAVLARARVSPLMFARTYQGNAAEPRMNINLQRAQANAYLQISSLNR